MPETVLVTGATGTQGGGLIKALLRLEKDTHIHALVRNPDSEASQKITALSPNNVQLFKGDFDDVDAIRAAAQGCTSAFLNVSLVHTEAAAEARHAQNLITVCASTPSIKRILHSSSGGISFPADSTLWSEYIPNHPDSGMSMYITSKAACEKIVKGTSTSDFTDGWCIIRGSMFYSNFLLPFTRFMYPEVETNQTITAALRRDLTTSYVDPADVSQFAAAALLSDTRSWNDKYKGKTVPLAKENLTFYQVIDSINRVLKNVGSTKQITITEVPEEEARRRAADGDMVMDIHLFQNKYPIVVEREEVEAFGIDVDQFTGVDGFFAREKEAVLAAVGGL